MITSRLSSSCKVAHVSSTGRGEEREPERGGENEKERKSELLVFMYYIRLAYASTLHVYTYESRCTFGCVWGSPSLLHSSIALSSYTLYVYNEELRKRVNSISEEWGQTHVFRLECKVLWLESLS